MGTLITFTATANDPEQGDISGSIVWESDLDGNIGNGASFNSNVLSPGTHVITARALDNEGIEGTDVVILNITNVQHRW